MPRPIVPFTIAFLSALASGCATPNSSPVKADQEVPAAWSSHHGSEGSIGAGSGGVVTGWLDSFQQPELRALVEECLAATPSWRAAAARLDAAGARREQAFAPLRPSFDVLASAGRGEDQSMPMSEARTQYRAGLDAAWEIDVWKRVTALGEATGKEALASAEDLAALRLSLAAQVAQAWFSLGELAGQVALAQSNRVSFSQTLAVVESRFEKGLTTSLDVRLTRASEAGARAAEWERRQVLREAIRGLETLLGRPPSASLSPPATLPEIPDTPPAGLPSSLLERRPDIRAAAARRQAAHYRLVASERDRLPRFALTGQTGITSEDGGDLLEGNDIYWQAGAAIRQSAYSGGAKVAAIALQQAIAEEADALWVSTVLQALREVEAALDAEHHLRHRMEELATSVTESKEAERLSLDLYNEGLTDISTVLDAQRRLFDAQSRHLAVRVELLRNRVRLHLALAGDFIQEDVDADLDKAP